MLASERGWLSLPSGPWETLREDSDHHICCRHHAITLSLCYLWKSVHDFHFIK